MDVDVKGAAFEGLLEKAASEGKKGRRPILHAAPAHPDHRAACMKPDPRGKPDFNICDPACGTGGFLVCCLRVARGNHEGCRSTATDAKRIKTADLLRPGPRRRGRAGSR